MRSFKKHSKETPWQPLRSSINSEVSVGLSTEADQRLPALTEIGAVESPRGNKYKGRSDQHPEEQELFPLSDKDSHLSNDTEYPEFYDSVFDYSDANDIDTADDTQSTAVSDSSQRWKRPGRAQPIEKKRSKSVQNRRAISPSSDSSASTVKLQAFRQKRPSLSRLYKPPPQSPEPYQYTVIAASDLDSSKSVSFASKVSVYDEPTGVKEKVDLKLGPGGQSGDGGPPLVIPQTTVSEAKCVKCRIGYMKVHFSFWALCLAVCCCPCGICCCLMMKEYKCSRCKYKTKTITLPLTEENTFPITSQPRPRRAPV